MDWLILILGVPAILIPLVLLFGFAGCTAQAPGLCADDSDCPVGTQCVEGLCIAVDDSPPSAPENLAAIALDDHRVSLTWNNTDPRATDISFQIERARENGEPVATPVQANLSPTGAASATDAFSLEEGVTFIYRVRAVLGEQVSDPSNESLATVFPAAPVNLVATPVSVNQIDLSWTNASATATEFSLERRPPGGAFAEIFRVRDAATTYSDSDPSLVEGTPYQYRVFAIVAADHGGVENNQPRDVISAASARAPATIVFTAAFTAPPADWKLRIQLRRRSRTRSGEVGFGSPIRSTPLCPSRSGGWSLAPFWCRDASRPLSCRRLICATAS